MKKNKSFLVAYVLFAFFVQVPYFAAMAAGTGESKNETSSTCMTALSDVRSDDDHLFLEEVYGDAALGWVRAQNEKSTKLLESATDFQAIRGRVKELLDAPDRLQLATYVDDWAYSFWQDEKNPQGLIRRTTIDDYLSGKPTWDVLLDIDELGKNEGKNWVFKGGQYFKGRALYKLSEGGKDAAVTREFDLATKTFVEDGFHLPEGKNSTTWVDENTLFIGLADQESEVTDSGYPKKVRVWKRGQKYEQAEIVFASENHDISASGFAHHDELTNDLILTGYSQTLDFYNTRIFVNTAEGRSVELPVPTDADVNFHKDHCFVHLKSDWVYQGKSFAQGSLLRLKTADFLSGKAEAKLIFAPTQTAFMEDFVVYKNRVLLLLMDNVNSKVVELTETQSGELLARTLDLPTESSISLSAYSDRRGLLHFQAENFITRATVYTYDLEKETLDIFKQAKERFDSGQYNVEQLFAKSKDGTRVPYYIVHRKGIVFDGSHPTIISGYGGFEVSEQPSYSPVMESAWLARGGVWVLANIRGGGEYGPAWHQAALKENRQRAYDDFFAVAEDVIARNITSPKRLGAVGGSNGGLLMGVAMTQRPDLFGAIAVQVPLLDMLRYHKLLAGASWMGEYGNPDIPAEREFIRRYSPYHNIQAGIDYPEVFFMTSTADDRVHPGHARRMARRLEEMGIPFLYYENIEGGHGGSANNNQSAYWRALQYTYFLRQLTK